MLPISRAVAARGRNICDHAPFDPAAAQIKALHHSRYKEGKMDGADPISWLMFGTLAAALLIAVVMLARFLRKPENRHPMAGQPERNIDEIRRDAGEQPPQ